MQCPDIAVLANCTHVALARNLALPDAFGEVKSFELYSLAPDQHAVLADHLAEFDYILTLEHGEKFGPLATRALRERFPDKVMSLPTPFFSGWQPDMAYLTNRGDFSSYDGLIGDYHSALILAECQDGRSEEEVVRRYTSGQAFDRLDIKGMWERGLSELRARETETDLKISGYIAEHAHEGQMFLSFNHPREGMIHHIAQSFARRVLAPDTVLPVLRPEALDLYQDAFWPVHPVVAEALGLPPASSPHFKSPQRFGAAHFPIEDFASRSYRFFNQDDPAKFAPITPAYLPDYLSPAEPEKETSLMAADRSSSNPPKEVVMTHFGRSGSTVLTKMLHQHSQIGWLDEIFSLIWLRTPEQYDFTVPQLHEIVRKGVATASRSALPAWVGHEIKLMNFMQNPSANMVDYAAETTDPARYAHIVLRRNNTLRRIFSVYKAMSTKVYHVDTSNTQQSATRYSVDLSNLFDPDTGQKAAHLEELIRLARKREEEVLSNYRRLGISYLGLTYEDDIEADPGVGYAKVLDYLGLPQEPAQVSLAKTSSSLKTEVINFDRVEAALKGTEYEWMLN